MLNCEAACSCHQPWPAGQVVQHLRPAALITPEPEQEQHIKQAALCAEGRTCNAYVSPGHKRGGHVVLLQGACHIGARTQLQKQLHYRQTPLHSMMMLSGPRCCTEVERPTRLKAR